MLAALGKDVVRHRHDPLGAHHEARLLEGLALRAPQRRLAEFEVASWELPMTCFFLNKKNQSTYYCQHSKRNGLLVFEIRVT